MKYIVIYNSRRIEIEAGTQLQAKNEGIARFKVPPSKAHLVIAVPSTTIKNPAPVSD